MAAIKERLAIEVQHFILLGNRVDQEFDGNGSHRIVINKTRCSEWTGYSFLSHIVYKGHRYYSATEFWKGTFEPVFTVENGDILGNTD